jgi:hypothetical protein
LESAVPQIVTGAFALGGVVITLIATSVQRRSSNQREDRLRFNEHRLSAVSDLLNSARKYRHAILATHAIASGDSPDKASALKRWAEPMQTAFETYHENATRVTLVVPDHVRDHLHAVSSSLDAVRAVRPGAPIEAANAVARDACNSLADAVRTLVSADR